MATAASPLAQKIKEALDFDKRLFFVLLVIIFLTIRYLTNTLILEAIPDSEQLDAQGDLLFFHIFNTLNYIWTPLALLWKFTVIAFLFWSISLTIGYKAPFKALWHFALATEFIFIFPELLRLLWYLNPTGTVTFLEIQNFEPLSVLWLLGPEQVDERFHYPLSILNLFEMAYGIAWVFGFYTISRRSIAESIPVVLLSYFLPLLLWLAFYAASYR
ncbi:MAG: sulfate ABC transporter permease [Bacteroidetes bacterium]|nr:sulfate ABC transporter permease [Bacteroidota bacterium]MDA1269577.1 sulfate ABC transporter permease [Bacteroidota bacterium]